MICPHCKTECNALANNKCKFCNNLQDKIDVLKGSFEPEHLRLHCINVNDRVYARMDDVLEILTDLQKETLDPETGHRIRNILRQILNAG